MGTARLPVHWGTMLARTAGDGAMCHLRRVRVACAARPCRVRVVGVSCSLAVRSQAYKPDGRRAAETVGVRRERPPQK